MDNQVEAKSFEVVHLQPETLAFERHGDTISLRLPNGRFYPRVILRSCFPVSENNLYLSVRDATLEEPKEIGIIDDWTLLKEDSRKAVSDEIGLYYFVPHITRIIKVKKELGFIYWTVETDKGPKEFVMRDSVVHFAREIAKDRWLLIDVNQARYEIRDLKQLDKSSQGMVRRNLYL